MFEYEKIKQLILKEKYNDENEYFYYFKNMNDGFDILNCLYRDGYKANRVKYDILKRENCKSSADKIIKLNAVIGPILSLLIGLNREELQYSNSKISNRNLFQYKDYEKNVISSDNVESFFNDLKEIYKSIKFHFSETSPFPYMLEIIKNDNNNKPYDLIAKIRNAFEHAEYYQPKGNIDIINITNENGAIFEGKLFLWLFRYFVEDYFGHGIGVASVMDTYEYQDIKKFTNYEELVTLLENFAYVKYEFTNVPDKYKFKGRDALFTKLNNAFDIGGFLKTNFDDVLKELSQEGVVYESKVTQLTKDEIIGFLKFIEKNYKNNIYNNEDTFKEIINLVKFKFSPNREIANCFHNILRYIDFKEDYLLKKTFPEENIFNEQNEDEYIRTTFLISLTLLKINIVNYSLESKKLEMPDLSQLEINDIDISSKQDLIDKIKKVINEGVDANMAFQYVILNTIRNAMAHGQERIKIIYDEQLIVEFDDKYNGKHFKIKVSLDNLIKIYSSDIFKPDNIKSKQLIKRI